MYKLILKRHTRGAAHDRYPHMLVKGFELELHALLHLHAVLPAHRLAHLDALGAEDLDEFVDLQAPRHSKNLRTTKKSRTTRVA